MKNNYPDTADKLNWWQWILLSLRMVIHLPGILWGYLYVAIFSWAVVKPRMEFPLILTAELKQWAFDKWGFSTVVSRGMLMAPGARREKLTDPLTRTEEHERVHVAQSEDFVILGLMLGVLISLVTCNWLWMLMWVFSPLFQLAHYPGSFLRHARPKPKDRTAWDHWGMNVLYRDKEDERSAFAQTDNHNDSWLKKRRNSGS